MGTDASGRGRDAPASGAPLTIRHADASLVVGALGRLHLCLIRGPLGPTTLDRARALHAELFAERGGPTATLAVLEPDVVLPGTELRERGGALLASTAGFTCAGAVLVAGAGFWTSQARSLVATTLRDVTSPYPIRLFADASSAATWLLARVDDRSLVVADVPAAVEALRDAR